MRIKSKHSGLKWPGQNASRNTTQRRLEYNEMSVSLFMLLCSSVFIFDTPNFTMNSRNEGDDRLFAEYYKHFRGDVAGKHNASIPKFYSKV